MVRSIVAAPVFEQVAYSLIGVAFLLSVVFDPAVNNKALELSLYSCMQLSTPFLAFSLGWDGKRASGDQRKSSDGVLFPYARQLLVLAALTSLISVLVIFLKTGALTTFDGILVVLGGLLATFTNAGRWQFLKDARLIQLMVAHFASIFVFAIVYFATRGIFSLPLLTAFCSAKATLLIAMIIHNSKRHRAPSPAKAASMIDFSPSQPKSDTLLLAGASYLRAEGTVPIASFLVSEHALVLGRALQYLMNLLKLVMVAVGNQQFFNQILSPQNFTRLIMVLGAAASVGGLLFYLVAGFTSSALPWLSGGLVAALSYLAIFRARLAADKFAAMWASLAAFAVFITLLITLPAFDDEYSIAFLLSELAFALIVFTKTRRIMIRD